MSKVAEFGSSFVKAPEWMQTEEEFNEIMQGCNFPEMIPLDYILLLQKWMDALVYDDTFLDVTALIHPELFEATYCLISVYSGGLI